MNQVHKENLTTVENALPNRQGLDIEIFGMEGVPEDILQQHNQRIIQNFYTAQAERQAATGNPPRGLSGGQGPTKKLKFETPEELKKRLAEHRTKTTAQKAAAASGIPPTAAPADGQPPTQGVSLLLVLPSPSVCCCSAKAHHPSTNRPLRSPLHNRAIPTPPPARPRTPPRKPTHRPPPSHPAGRRLRARRRRPSSCPPDPRADLPRRRPTSTTAPRRVTPAALPRPWTIWWRTRRGRGLVATTSTSLLGWPRPASGPAREPRMGRLRTRARARRRGRGRGWCMRIPRLAPRSGWPCCRGIAGWRGLLRKGSACCLRRFGARDGFFLSGRGAVVYYAPVGRLVPVDFGLRVASRNAWQAQPRLTCWLALPVEFVRNLGTVRGGCGASRYVLCRVY